MKPLGKFVLVEPAEAETQTSSGIILAESAQEKPQRGTVLEVGEEVETVAPGDEVVYSRYGGTEIFIERVKYIIVRVNDIYLVVD